MKTHELAKALSRLAAALRSLPDMELDPFLSGVLREPGASRPHNGNPDAAISVAILASLSRMDKPQWKELIEQWRLPIKVLRKDSARNVMGDVMRYLESHPEEIRRIEHGASKGSSRASPALLKALQILMKSDKNIASDHGEESQPRD
jgi:hypothetical protein